MPALHTHDASPYQPATLCRSSPGRRSRGRAFTCLVALRTLLVRFLRAGTGKDPPGVVRHAARPLQPMIYTLDFETPWRA
jgi:hypothetical protein